MLGRGIYTMAEAGRYAGVSSRTARAWFEGWPQSRSGPVLHSDYAQMTERPIVSFLDFTDLLVVAQLRKVGASMPSIRRAYDALEPIVGSKHPFSHSDLYADQTGTLFRRAATAAGDDILIEVLKQQHTFPSILLPFLQRICYDEATHLARSYIIEDGILLDSHRRYGKPITRESGMPTTILARFYEANGRNVELVADWYGVETAEVLRAVQFEQEFKSAA